MLIPSLTTVFLLLSSAVPAAVPAEEGTLCLQSVPDAALFTEILRRQSASLRNAETTKTQRRMEQEPRDAEPEPEDCADVPDCEH